MGGMTAFATQAFQVLGAVNTVLGAVDQFSKSSGKRDYTLQTMQNAETLRIAQENAAIKKDQIMLSAQMAEEERRNALRRAIAKQKAVYGAGGIDSTTGSAQALLLGRVAESEKVRQENDALDALRIGAANLGVDQQKRINTLQLTQLREKNKYNQITAGFEFANTIGAMLND